MRAAKLLPIALLCALVLTGCPNPRELKTAAQASEFIDDIAKGGSIDDWAREAGAVAAADKAWLYRDEIERIGQTLRDKGPEWACDTAEYANTAAEYYGIYRKLNPQDYEAIILEAERRGASREEANSLIEEVLLLGESEAVEAVDAVCSAGL